MDAFDLMGQLHDRAANLPSDEGDWQLGDDPSYKGWPELDMEEVERVGRSLATLFGITLDE
jgi:hypothetical protein